MAGICGGTTPAVLNAANEIAVAAFLAKKIKFVDLPRIIDKVLNTHVGGKYPSLEGILNADSWARIKTTELLERITS
jgi:1-deoxy-D-xylulose 5-phosphate reductoisomerase